MAPKIWKTFTASMHSVQKRSILTLEAFPESRFYRNTPKRSLSCTMANSIKKDPRYFAVFLVAWLKPPESYVRVCRISLCGWLNPWLSFTRVQVMSDIVQRRSQKLNVDTFDTLWMYSVFQNPLCWDYNIHYKE